MANWNNLNPGSWPNREELQDAVDKGYFIVTSPRTGVPTPLTNDFVTKSEAVSWVDLDVNEIPSEFPDDWWLPVKYYKGVFPVVKDEIYPEVSPNYVAYEPTSQLVFFSDRDNANAGVRWFDPQTITHESDVQDVAGTTDTTSHDSVIPTGCLYITGLVSHSGKVYCHGGYTGGCIVISGSSKTVTKTIPYGQQSTYDRQVLEVIGDAIWAFSSNDGGFQVIDPSTDTITYLFSISSFGRPAARVVKVGSEIWVQATQDGLEKTTIYIYPYQTTAIDPVNDVVTTINNIDNNTFDGDYLCYPMWYDSSNSKVYIPCVGDNCIYVYDSTSYALVHTINIPLTGTNKNNVATRLCFRKTTGQLYANLSFCNSYSDTQLVRRVIEIDRTTYAIKATLNDTSYSDMVYVDVMDMNYTADPGDYYASGNPGWDTDGSIKIFD